MLILLYILDSLRRDALGCYGNDGVLTPHLDAFAAGATRYTAAYAAAPWSKASAAALLTGQLPRAVGMRSLLGALPAAVPTVAERLAAERFDTVAVSANPFVSDDFGLLRGFAERIEGFRPGVFPGEPFHFHVNHFRRLADSLSVPPEALVLARSPALHDALLERLGTGPTLALVWSMDTHAPFFVRGERSHFGNPLDRVIPAADAEWLTDGLTARDLVALYRDMVAYNDESFGTLMAELRVRGLWEEALVIVAADHGEGFGEHGVMGHTSGLWEEQIGVPLLVKFPGQRVPATVATPVSLLDIVPTIELLLGLSADGPRDGLPLPLLTDALRPLLAESPDGWALRHGEHKALAPRDGNEPRLFNLATDPGEQLPLPDDALRQDLAAHADALRTNADARAATLAAPPAPALDDAVAARLQALGYL